MMQQVFKRKKHDVKFQTSYVLFVLYCFLCRTTKDVVSTKLYLAVHDLKQTHTYAWAEFVLHWLAAEIAKYKKRNAKAVEGKKDSVGVAGCVLRLMYTNAAFHDLKKYFVNQMQLLNVLDAALMGDVPETCTRNPSKSKASANRKNRNENDVDMGDVHMDVEDFPSTSSVNPKKVRHGVDMEDMDGSRMSGLLFAQDMPLYSPEHVMADVLQHVQHVELQEETVVEKEGDKQDEGEEHYEEEENDDDEEDEDEEKYEED
ncbi:hypothetical protein RHMOL_Rhmol01G0268800 [Rhododendron molle]|uniref:Uncharacterized protein n=1 Tax=Rhododendron molle TaxID=49168 RepID=A0ACC0Q6E3_RHOML|nr:hypothetical protein RHMOL_Rhmol01G0268800 [Rhododendron molle]